jgi:hypothetical protein
MKTNTIGFIGGGRITRIYLQAFKNKSMTLNFAHDLFYHSDLTHELVINLIVKPIGENESEIKEILNTKLMGLFNKIKPQKPWKDVTL